MSTVTKSIGTSGRDYSTITAWEADLDNAAVYASGDDAVGECYNDSAFDESVAIDGGGTIGLASVTLTVAAGERHDGTAGTGAVISCSAARTIAYGGTVSKYVTASYLELNGNGFTSAFAFSYSNYCSILQCLVHDTNGTTNSSCYGIYGYRWQNQVVCSNNIVYNIYKTAGRNFAYGIGTYTITTPRDTISNNTVFNIKNTSPYAYGAVGISAGNNNYLVHNNVSCGTSTINGTAFDYGGSSTTASTNLSSDATAFGTNSLTNKSAADQFVSTVLGSEDLHLKAGADCIDAGTDLGTTPTGVNIDIDGRDRHAMDDVWDIGADEYVNPVARFPWQVRRQRRMAGTR